MASIIENAKRIGALLQEKHWTVAVAESCTGGMIGAAITAIPGSSAYFKGGVIAYANDIKEQVLGIPPELIKKRGVVSYEVVEAMALGAARLCKTECSIAVSGIAGPDGGTVEKPVGLVCIGFYVAGVTSSVEQRLSGDRDSIRKQAVEAALEKMSALLSKQKSEL